jgi:hypothetical protein
MPRIRMARAAGPALIAAATIALTACGSSAAFPAYPAWLTSHRPAGGGPPAYFIDNEAWSPSAGYTWSDFTVRDTATGRAVSQRGHGLSHRVTAVAAIGGGAAFIAAEEAPVSCGSQLYWFRLDRRGRVSALSPLGPALGGEVNSLTASADGQTIAYTLAGCRQGDRGYLRVLNLRTGQLGRWSSVDLTGNGRIGMASDLTLSADGKLLAFVGWLPGGQHPASVRILATSRSQPGDLLGLSRPVRQLPGIAGGPEPQDAIALSPRGRVVYLCSVSAQRRSRVTTIASYRTATGRAAGPSVQLAAGTPANGHPLPGCAMTVSHDGRYALVSYGVSYPDPGSGVATLAAASVNLAARQPSAFSFPVRMNPALAGPRSVGVSFAW